MENGDRGNAAWIILQRKAASPFYRNWQPKISGTPENFMCGPWKCWAKDQRGLNPSSVSRHRPHEGCWDIRGGWTGWPLKVSSHPNHFDSMTLWHLFTASLQHPASACAGAAAATYLQLGWILSWQWNQATVQSHDEDNKQHAEFVTVVSTDISCIYWISIYNLKRSFSLMAKE